VRKTDDGDSRGAGDVSRLLRDWRDGDRDAANRVFALVYRELRTLARRALPPGRRELADPGTTSLVHDVYAKLVERPRLELKDRQHFFALAARAMRQVLVDRARARGARKRGEVVALASFDEGPADQASPVTEILVLDQALTRLGEIDPRLVRLVELRVFGGLSVAESAEVLGSSERTVKRDWSRARAFLALELAPKERAPR